MLSRNAEVEFMMEMGLLVRDIRKLYDYSQEQLARDMEVSQTFLSYIENGQRLPSLYTLKNMAEAMGLDLVIAMRPKAKRKSIVPQPQPQKDLVEE